MIPRMDIRTPEQYGDNALNSIAYAFHETQHSAVSRIVMFISSTDTGGNNDLGNLATLLTLSGKVTGVNPKRMAVYVTSQELMPAAAELLVDTQSKTTQGSRVYLRLNYDSPITGFHMQIVYDQLVDDTHFAVANPCWEWVQTLGMAREAVRDLDRLHGSNIDWANEEGARSSIHAFVQTLSRLFASVGDDGRASQLHVAADRFSSDMAAFSKARTHMQSTKHNSDCVQATLPMWFTAHSPRMELRHFECMLMSCAWNALLCKLQTRLRSDVAEALLSLPDVQQKQYSGIADAPEDLLLDNAGNYVQQHQHRGIADVPKDLLLDNAGNYVQQQQRTSIADVPKDVLLDILARIMPPELNALSAKLIRGMLDGAVTHGTTHMQRICRAATYLLHVTGSDETAAEDTRRRWDDEERFLSAAEAAAKDTQRRWDDEERLFSAAEAAAEDTRRRWVHGVAEQLSAAASRVMRARKHIVAKEKGILGGIMTVYRVRIPVATQQEEGRASRRPQPLSRCTELQVVVTIMTRADYMTHTFRAELFAVVPLQEKKGLTNFFEEEQLAPHRTECACHAHW